MKFEFFTSKASPLIGVDISSSAVKMVELIEVSHQNFRLQSYSTTEIPADALVDGNIIKLEALVEGITKCWKKLRSSERQVAIALPTSSVITKKVMLPHDLTEDEMEAQVELEASEFVPFPLDEINIDFYPTDEAPNHNNEIEVLIAASRKEKIEDRVAAVEGAGLKAMVMDVENYAFETALSMAPELLLNHGRNKTLMIVDIGAQSMKVNVLNDLSSVHTSEQAFGGAKLTLEIKQRFELSMDEAEAAKRSGKLPENYHAEVLQPFLNTLAMEIYRAIQMFTNATHYGRVDQIVLVGGCASLTGIQKVVADHTQINTIVFNPFTHLALDPKVKKAELFKDAPALMVAYGLAMRGFA